MPKKSSKKLRKDEVESTAHYAGVMLEEIRDQVQLVAESVQMTRESLEGRIESVRGELKQDIADTQDALKMNREVLETRIDSVEQRLSGEIGDLKTGMRMLNQKIDGIGIRFDRHDEEIKDLRKVQNLS